MFMSIAAIVLSIIALRAVYYFVPNQNSITKAHEGIEISAQIKETNIAHRAIRFASLTASTCFCCHCSNANLAESSWSNSSPFGDNQTGSSVPEKQTTHLVPEFITVEQAYIEDSDGTPANVRDNDAIEAIRALIALISKPLPVFYVDPSKDATGVIAPILQELRGIKEAVKEGAASRENDVFGGTYRAMARFRDPPDEIELEKIARLINDGWKWKDAVMEVYPDTKPEELDREVNRLQHVWKRDRKKPKNKLI